MQHIHKRFVVFSAALAVAIFAAGCAVGPGWGSSPYSYGAYPDYYGGPGYAYNTPYYGNSYFGDGYGYYPYSGYQGYPYQDDHDQDYHAREHLYRYNQRRLAQQYWNNQQTFNRQYQRNQQIFDQQYQKNLRTYMQKNPGAPVPH